MLPCGWKLQCGWRSVKCIRLHFNIQSRLFILTTFRLLAAWTLTQHEIKYSPTLRHLSLNTSIAEAEPLTFLLFLLLLLQTLHILQCSKNPTYLIRNHPASSSHTNKTSTMCPSKSNQCSTLLNPELERIRNKHTILASTGCSREFCQSGRMTHTDEPRGMYSQA